MLLFLFHSLLPSDHVVFFSCNSSSLGGSRFPLLPPPVTEVCVVTSFKVGLNTMQGVLMQKVK